MTEVNATKPAPLVMMCVVILALVAGFSFALASGLTHRMESAVSSRDTNLVAGPNLGEAINDPKPGRPVRN